MKGIVNSVDQVRIDTSGLSARGFSIANGTDIILDTVTGSKIGTGATQKLSFYNATPVVQPTAVANATGSGDAHTQLNLLLTRLRTLGLIAT
jgi:hypothetical protein